MEDVEKIIIDKMFIALNELIDNKPLQLELKKETTILFMPLYLILLSRIDNYRGIEINVGPYINKIILSDLQSSFTIEKNF